MVFDAWQRRTVRRLWSRLGPRAGRSERLQVWECASKMDNARTLAARRAAAEEMYRWARQEEDALRAAGVVGPEGVVRPAFDIALAAVETERFDEAKERGEELLVVAAAQRARRSSRAVPDGGTRMMAHEVLGRVAVQRGEVAEAERHLLDECDSISQLALSRPPRAELAHALLDLGKTETVLAFLDGCEAMLTHPSLGTDSHWEKRGVSVQTRATRSVSRQIAAWTAEIRTGRCPRDWRYRPPAV